MSRVLVTFKDNLWDDMDIEGFKVFESLNEWKAYLTNIGDMNYPVIYQVGTNQDITYMFPVELENKLQVVDTEFVATINDMHKYMLADGDIAHFGQFPELNELEESEEWEDDEDDDYYPDDDEDNEYTTDSFYGA